MIVAPDPGGGSQLVHGSSVAVATTSGWQGALILGRSGAGKSELAMEMIGLGARLVADDQTRLIAANGAVLLEAPNTIAGLIEIRGMGLLQVDYVAQARLRLVVDLDQAETERLPPARQREIMRHAIPLLRRCSSRAFAAGLMQYLRMPDTVARQERTE